MKLRQPEPFGAPDKDGVCAGDIEAVLDDVGGKKNIAIAFRKVDDQLFRRIVLVLLITSGFALMR